MLTRVSSAISMVSWEKRKAGIRTSRSHTAPSTPVTAPQQAV